MRSLFRSLVICCVAVSMLHGQTNTGALSGTVVDAQGAIVVGAKVSAINLDTNSVITATTEAAGSFVLVNLPPARYSVVVEHTGFKKFEKTGIVLTANTSLPVGQIVLQVGQIEQTVEVSADAAQLQTESSEQATSIVGNQIENTQVNGRSVLALLSVVPGVYTDSNDFSVANNQTGNIYTNGTRGTTFNVTINGASNIDTGSNTKMMATVSLDSVQEVRVLTSNFDAQYGKNSGGQIMIVTKGGTSAFHGGGYWYYRDHGLNANNWMNNRDGLVKPAYHFNYEGYTIGGPVYIPRRFNLEKNKLFFFWSEEYQQQLLPEGSVRRVTVPTALERQGDYSQSVDQSGNKVTIRDYTTGAAFPGNVIPQSRLYAPGIAALSFYPLPNIAGQKGYNYQSQISGQEPRHEQLLRMDYNATSKWRFNGSLTRLPSDTYTSSYCPSGYSLCPNIPLTPIQYYHPGYVLTLNATTIISPTVVNEFLFDIAHHPVQVRPENPNAFTRATTGINLPTIYPPYADWIPNMTFGGTRIGSGPNFDTGGGAWTPFNTYNSTLEWVDNISKVYNTHLLKGGFYLHRNRKNQSAYALTGGSYSFGDSTSNPYDTGFGFANAAIGTFGSFTQANKYVTGQYRYTNAEFYLQDTWKIKPSLTLNYGVRAYWVQPYYDAGMNTANFLPEKFDVSKAPRLYYPAFDASGNRVALDRLTGETAASYLIGLIVPNSGSLADGILQAGKGISKYLMKSPGLLWAPRVGLAWSPLPSRSLVFRSGFGAYYDRYQGNDIFNTITNPPNILQSTVYNGLATTLQQGTQYYSPFGVSAIDYNGNIPTVMNYSAGVQSKLPFSLMLNASYVGSISRHLMEVTNINAVPYGADFLARNQDPTKVKSSPNAIPGSNAYDTNFLRPYPGYTDINLEGFGATGNYNSLQVKLDRSFAKGLFVTTAFTWSKCMTTAGNDGSAFRIDNLSRFALYAPCDFNIPLNFTVNFVYELPRVSQWGPMNHVITRAIFDTWQISGLGNMGNGTPYSPGFSVPNYGNNQLTGSNTQGARVWLVGNPLEGTSDSPYNRLNPGAFLPPRVGSIGIESPRNYLVGPGVDNWQMSLQRNFRITEKSKLQFRADAFNVFNHTQFSGINSQINFAGINNPTITNPAINANGTLNKTGFGTVSGARGARVLQIVARFSF